MRRISYSYGDKTVLDVRKQEERELSEQIHKNLQLLNIMYPRNYEFQSLYCQDMFMKPNTKAFPFMMHYLFTILDPNEFKKRFYWPLDRTSENVFRSNTVQYLNYLNEKHNLGWGEIKAFLVVMPGGIKFMKLLAHIIDLVVDEEIRKLEKTLPDGIDKSKLLYTQESISDIVKIHETYMTKSVAYKEKLNAQKEIVLENSSKLERKLNNIIKEAGLSSNQLDEKFFHNYSHSNFALFERTISDKVNEIVDTEKYLDKLSEEIDLFYNEKHQFPCDKSLLISSYKSIQTDYPTACPKNIFTRDNKILLSSLFNAFNCICPKLEEALGQCEVTKNRMEKYEFEISEVARLQNEAMQLDTAIFKLENQVDEFKIDSNDLSKSTGSETLASVNTPSRLSTSTQNSIKSKYISTPVIYMPKIDPSTSRIALLEQSLDYSFDFASQATVIAAKSMQVKNNSLLGMSSKTIDPLSLLRTVTRSACHKNKQSRLNTSNISVLPSRFKENNGLFERDKENLSKTIAGAGCLLATPLSRKQSDLCTMESTTADRRQAMREKLMTNHDITLSPDSIVIHKKPHQNSVQITDFKSISKSPSGRLEALLKSNQDFNLPNILITDLSARSLNPLNSSEIEDKTTNEIDNNLTVLENKNISEKNTTCADLTNFCLDFNQKLGLNSSKESIFDVSDSVLKDISL